MSERPLGRAGLFCQEVSDGCVLFDPDGQKVYVLNATAAFVWTCCDGDHGVEEMVEELATTLGPGGPERGRLRTDVEKALDDFRRQGLLSA
jgi:hypothetical protein